MTSPQGINIRFSLAIIILVLLTFLCGIFFGLAVRTRTLLHESILSQGRSHFQSIVLTRAWNAQHGGVYVLKTEGMQSNPYLHNPDIVTTDGQIYTKKNPALMTREISELADLEAGMVFNVTSLNPLNPKNIADAFETGALQTFEAGQKEFYSFSDLDGKPVFRYMAPLVTTAACLSCHAEQGYQVGDIRGGISVTILVAALQEKLHQNMVTIGIFGSIITLALICTVSMLIIRLVRLLNKARAEMETLAITDVLTGTYNRRYGVDQLAIEINKAQRLNYPLCCFIVDLDHFKKVNDSYGHDAGDNVLILIAEELQKQLRKYDILFRYGGEEFVVIFPGLSLEDARGCADRIRQFCAELCVPIDNGAQQIQVTLSGGLTALKEGDSTGDEMLKRADTALYQAKENGRNRIEELL